MNKNSMKNFRLFAVAALLLSLASVGLVTAQNARRVANQTVRAATTTSADPVAALPASDVVMLVDMNRVLNEMVPSVLAGDAARLAAFNAQIDRFRGSTGIDPRAFDRVAVGLRYVDLPTGGIKVDPVAVVTGIGQGTFNPDALIAAGRIAANGKYTEQAYRNSRIYTFTLGEQISLPFFGGVRVGEISATPLNNMLVIGTPDSVRRTIDAGANRTTANAALAQLATRTPNAILSFGANVPQRFISAQSFPNDEIKRNVESIRQLYGGVSAPSTPVPGGKTYDVLLAARTTDANAARNLNGTLGALSNLGRFAVGRIQGPAGQLARSAIDTLTINQDGSDVLLRFRLPESDFAALLGATPGTRR